MIPEIELSVIDRLSVLLLALAAAFGAFAFSASVIRISDDLRRRMLEETELELRELLLQLPANQLISAAAALGSFGGVLAFFVVGAMGRGFDISAGIVAAVVVFVVALLLPKLILRILRQRRREKLGNQLEEALGSMSNSLKAGFSIQQALEAIVQQGHQPISVEFKMVIQQTRLGMSLDDALRDMARRVQLEDFQLTSSAIAAARITGGDLTGVLERLAHMIRERRRIQRRVQSLTAQGRLQGLLLAVLPFLMLLLFFAIRPKMIIGFFQAPIGIACFILCMILQGIGYLFIRKIVNIDI